MKKVPLTQGLFALVDNDDHERVSAFNWYAESRGKGRGFYARSQIAGRKIRLHQFILGVDGIDHRDGDGLDNRKKNLRPASASENQRAKRRKRRGTSKFRGVYWHSHAEKWAAVIKVSYRSIYLGLFIEEIDAAKAYDLAARSHFKQFATLNFP